MKSPEKLLNHCRIQRFTPKSQPKSNEKPQKLLNHCRNERFTPKSQPQSNEKPQKASKSLPHSGLAPYISAEKQ